MRLSEKENGDVNEEEDKDVANTVKSSESENRRILRGLAEHNIRKMQQKYSKTRYKEQSKGAKVYSEGDMMTELLGRVRSL